MATEKNILWPTTDFGSTVISVKEEQRNPKVRKIEQQRCKVRLPKRKQAEKLKSREMKEGWMNNDEWMKDEWEMM